jgi:hypothetical protein
MRLRVLFVLVLAAWGVFPATAAVEPPPAQPPEDVDLGRLRPGMTQDEVRQVLGPPQRVARQVLYRRYLEQWLYERPRPVRVEFDCVRGQPPQVLSVQPLPLPKP